MTKILGEFHEKVALVTGGGGGIGRAVALAFAEAGAVVVVCDIVRSNAEETVSLIEGIGGKGRVVQMDVSKSEDVRRMVATAVNEFGGLNLACNAAAIDLERVPLAECPEEIFDQVIAVNLRGMFLCLKYEIRQMLRNGGGAIVNISSVTAFRARGDNNASYSASKAGLVALSRNAAMRYAQEGVKVNTILPGAIDTPMLRSSIQGMTVTAEELAQQYGALRRFGAPSEIAQGVLWLCSDRSALVCGHALPLDGGFLVR